ncbi:MAG: hypothetical protein H7145_15435, partial [Akkermansiaceae bacterium]|nr:hypothetical protein [Armatimonadota bacterium]
MSLFNKPQNPDNTPSEERLREWGDAERTVPPIRRGRFANVSDRLTRGATDATSPQTFRCRPAFVIGGVSIIAATVAFASFPEPEPRKDLLAAAVSETSTTRSLPSAKRRAKVTQKTADAWPKFRLIRYEGGLAMRVDPVFIDARTYGASMGRRHSAAVPFVATIRNDGAAFAGRISVSVGSLENPERSYTYPVSVPGHATLQTTVYPELSPYNNQQFYNIRLITPTRTLSLDSGSAISNGTNNNRPHPDSDINQAVAILDNRLGVLSPRRSKESLRTVPPTYQTLHGKPQNAPDRAIGYDAIDVLILGHGCEEMKPSQWVAIREWVKDGGSLVLLGGSPEMRRVLATPAALSLSPAEQFAAETRTTPPQLKVTYFDIDPIRNGYFDYDRDITLLFPSTLSTITRAKADAKIIFRSPVRGRAQWATIGARRTLGAGSVAFYGFDPTSP